MRLLHRLVPLVCLFAAFVTTVSAQVPPLIGYQGRLVNGTSLVNGTVSMRLLLYTNATGGVQLYEDTGTVIVADGLYATFIGDGTAVGTFPDVLTNAPLYLEIIVNSTILSPREQLASVGYALLANGVRTGGVTSAMIAAGAVQSIHLATGAVLGANIAGGAISNVHLAADAVASSNIVDGTVAATDLSAGTFSQTFWKVDGNAGTATGTSFIGTTDNKPLEIRVNNARAGLITPTSGSPNVIFGSPQNVISNGVHAATILGGSNNAIGFLSHDATIVGGSDNRIVADGTYNLVGGFQNIIYSNADVVLLFGSQNVVSNFSDYAVLAGGSFNRIGASNFSAVLAGGDDNTIDNGSADAVIGGGSFNHIGSNAFSATVAGGGNNTASGDYAAVPGGQANTAAGRGSLAAGISARALHDGTFVWADTQPLYFQSTASNQFLVRANGGFGINTTNPAAALHVVRDSQSVFTANANSIAVFERNASGFIQMLNPSTAQRGILFGDENDPEEGGIIYNSSRSLQLRTGGNVSQMTITSNGLVGIGTTAPETVLNVQRGSAGLTANSSALLAIESSTAAFIHVMTPTNAVSGILFGTPLNSLDGSIRYNNGNDRELTFRTGGNSQRMIITSNGNVGVGTSIPSNKLEVIGDVAYGTPDRVFAAGGEENLRIVRGEILTSGGVFDGSGFTALNLATGQCRIVFSSPFSAAPTVTATVHDFFDRVASIESASTTSVEIHVKEAGSGTYKDWFVDFIAIGPR